MAAVDNKAVAGFPGFRHKRNVPTIKLCADICPEHAGQAAPPCNMWRSITLLSRVSIMAGYQQIPGCSVW